MAKRTDRGSLSLNRDCYEALAKRSKESGVSMSNIVESLIALSLDDGREDLDILVARVKASMSRAKQRTAHRPPWSLPR